MKKIKLMEWYRCDAGCNESFLNEKKVMKHMRLFHVQQVYGRKSEFKKEYKK